MPNLIEFLGDVENLNATPLYVNLTKLADSTVDGQGYFMMLLKEHGEEFIAMCHFPETCQVALEVDMCKRLLNVSICIFRHLGLKLADDWTFVEYKMNGQILFQKDPRTAVVNTAICVGFELVLSLLKANFITLSLSFFNFMRERVKLHAGEAHRTVLATYVMRFVNELLLHYRGPKYATHKERYPEDDPHNLLEPLVEPINVDKLPEFEFYTKKPVMKAPKGIRSRELCLHGIQKIIPTMHDDPVQICYLQTLNQFKLKRCT